VADALARRGASFLRDLRECGLDEREIAAAVAELVAAGLVASDGFAGLRGIISTAAGRSHAGPDGAHGAGRWSLLPEVIAAEAHDGAVEAQAWSLLRRYGVVCRRLLAREANAAPWRELARVYRRLEARGEIRGGRFVSGLSGEQFALPDAVTTMRDVRRRPPEGRLLTISAADPLNLAGIVTAGERVRAVGSNRVVYRDGVPMAALEGNYMKPLVDQASIGPDVASALTGRRLPAVTAGFVGA
jgi:ATP-dependent Lhr-like helicase